LPIDGPPIENGVVVVKGNHIESVLTRDQLKSQGLTITKDYGQAIITPGLINLHTHLDYSDLALFDTQSGFFKWIANLMANAWKWGDEQWKQSALNGACAIAESGTTLIVDSSFTGQAANAAAQVGLRAIVGLEVFGIEEETSKAVWQSWLQKYHNFLNSAPDELRRAIDAGLIVMTVAPHTPYTVCPSLWQCAKDWADEEGRPVLVHISESQQECEWIHTGNAELDAFLKNMPQSGSEANYSWRGKGLSPVEHLDSWGLLSSNTLAAHAVHLSDRDIELLKKAQVSIAHCPRSNSRLRNGVARLLSLVESGLHVGLGTDSSASVDDLNVLNEARFAWNLHRAVNPAFSLTAKSAIEALTTIAAQAVGLSDKVGTLTPGKEADIAVFAIAGNYRQDTSPYDVLLYGGTATIDVFVAGKPIVRDCKVSAMAHQVPV
jgi:cytosine/adenosine deaminase-related metal-dependent hydrolase